MTLAQLPSRFLGEPVFVQTPPQPQIRATVELMEVFSWYLAIRNPIEEVLAEHRWKIGPPNLRHQPAGNDPLIPS